MGIDLGALGDLVIELGVDIAPLQDDLNQGANIAQAGADKISDAIGSATTGTDQLQQGLDDVVTSLNSAGTAATNFGSDAQEATTGTSQLSGDLQSLGIQMTDVQTSTDSATKSLGEVKPAAESSSEGLEKAKESAGEMKESLTELLAEVGLAVGGFEILKESLEDLSQEQDLKSSFTILSGSAETAETALEGLRGKASELHVEINDLFTVARNLAPQFGVDTKAMADVLQAAGDAAAATGKSFDSIASGLDRIAISGQVSTRQLVQFGISIEDIATTMGKSVDDATKLLTKGAQTAQADVQVVIDTIERRFPDAARTVSTNISGQFIDLKNQLDKVFDQIGEAILPIAEDLLAFVKADVVPAIKELVAEFNNLSPSTKDVIEALGLGVIAIGAIGIAATAVSAALGPISGLIEGITASFTALEVVAGAEGLVATLTALGPLTVAFGVAIAAWAIYEAVTKLQSLNAELDRLYDAQSKGVTATKEQADEISKLNAIIDQHNSVIGNQQIVIDKTGLSIEQYIEAAKKALKGTTDWKVGQGEFGKILDDGTIKLGTWVTGTADATKSVGELKLELKNAQEDVSKYAELLKDGFDVSDKLADAQQRVIDIQAKLNPSLKQINDLAATYIDKGTQVVSVVGDLNDVNEQQVTQWTDTRTALKGYTDDTLLAADQVKFFNQDLEGLLGWSNELPASLDKQTTAVQKLSGAMGKDFIKSLADAEAGQKALDQEYKDAGVPNADEMTAALARNQQAYEDLKEKGLVTAYGEMVHDQETLKDQITQQTNLGLNTDDLKLKYSHLQDQLATVKTGFTDTAKAITDAIGTDTQKAIDDLITGVGNLGDDFKKMGEDVVDIFVNRIIKDAMKPLLDALDSVIDKALQAAEDVLGIGGGKGGVLGTGVGLPSGTKIPGTGAGEGIPGVDGQPGIDTGAGGAAGSAGSAASGALTGIISAVSGVVSAITGIVGIFQSAHQENTLKDIESHTKVIAIATLGISDVSEKNQQGNETVFYFNKRVADGTDILVTAALAQHLDAVLIQNGIAGLYGFEKDWIYPRLADIVANTSGGLKIQPTTNATVDLSGAAKESLVSRTISPDTPVVNAQVDNSAIIAAIADLQSQLIPMVGKITDSVIQLPALLGEEISLMRQSTGAPAVPTIDAGSIPDVTKATTDLQAPLQTIAGNSDRQTTQLTNILSALSQINNNIVSVGARIMPTTPETILPNGNIQENSGSIVNALLGLQQTLLAPLRVTADIATQLPSLLISGFSSIASAAVPVAVQNQTGFNDLLASTNALQEPLTDLNKTVSKELDMMNVAQAQGLAFQGSLNNQLSQITTGIQGTTSMVQALSLNESHLIDLLTPWGDVFGGMSQALNNMLAFSQGQVYPRLADILVALGQLNETSRQIVVSVMLDGQQILSAMTAILEQQGVKSPAY